MTTTQSNVFLSAIKELFKNIEEDNIEKFNENLIEGVNLDYKDLNNNTLLYKAVLKGNTRIVKILIENGADVNLICGKMWETPLYIAVKKGNEEISTLLIENGANVNALNLYKESPLHWAAFFCQEEIALKLIDNGADVNIIDNSNSTPLDNNSLNANGENIRRKLIENGAKNFLNIKFDNFENKILPILLENAELISGIIVTQEQLNLIEQNLGKTVFEEMINNVCVVKKDSKEKNPKEKNTILNPEHVKKALKTEAANNGGNIGKKSHFYPMVQIVLSSENMSHELKPCKNPASLLFLAANIINKEVSEYADGQKFSFLLGTKVKTENAATDYKFERVKPTIKDILDTQALPEHLLKVIARRWPTEEHSFKPNKSTNQR
ncbi:ankyrin repeat domain-containing protein [Rickettsiales bacterium]|nr:ankyrin repeat domain-containing protein [Rickettsiales bacterium]